MSENIRTENWCGYDIRFVEHEGSWYAVLKDICDALKLRTDSVRLRVECDHMVKLAVTGDWNRPISYNVAINLIPHSECGVKIGTQNVERTFEMLCVDEAGIYQALSRSTRLEARKFIDWISRSLVDLRKAVGLEAYEALKLTDSDIQKLIADRIDISYKEPTGDLIPVKAEPTIMNNIHNHYDVDYRKVVLYAGIGCVSAIVLYHGVKYIVKRVKAKKAGTVEKKED